MLSTNQTITNSPQLPATARDQVNQDSPQWLLRDLMAVLDYSVQEGDYEEAGMIRALIQEALSWEADAA